MQLLRAQARRARRRGRRRRWLVLLLRSHARTPRAARPRNQDSALAREVAVLRTVFRRALGFGALQDAVAEGLGSRQCVAAERVQCVARSRGVLGSPEDLAEATRASRVWEFVECGGCFCSRESCAWKSVSRSCSGQNRCEPKLLRLSSVASHACMQHSRPSLFICPQPNYRHTSLRRRSAQTCARPLR